MANIYQKVQTVRVQLQAMNLKKTGKNQNFKYYELGDFLPQAMDLFEKHGLFSNISFGQDMAVLTIINSESPEEKETWTSTIAEANLRVGSPIQSLGAMQTYLRRYLYINALEIIENDELDATIDVKKEIVQEITDKQIKFLYTLASKKGITSEQMKAVVKGDYKKESTKELTKKEYEEIVKRMEAKEDVRNG